MQRRMGELDFLDRDTKGESASGEKAGLPFVAEAGLV